MIKTSRKIRHNFYKGEKTDHFDGTRFYNPWDRFGKKGFIDLMKWRLQAKGSEWPNWVENEARPPLAERSAALRACYIGHATILVQINGLNILTDPIFSDRASPFVKMGPKRIRAPFLEPGKLPKIDFVFVSHNHYDHMDLPSLSWLAQNHRPVFITPLGNPRHIRPVAYDCEIRALDWHEETSLGKDVTLAITPSQHWSRRTLYDTNRDLWGGFFLKDNQGQSLYFSGETGFEHNLFEGIATRHGNPEIALLPIGAYEPRWFMQYAHMNPDDAVRAHKILKAQKSMAFHFETFCLTDEAFTAPREDIKKALEKHEIRGQDFIIPYPGDVLSL